MGQSPAQKAEITFKAGRIEQGNSMRSSR
jgi:hypothetical protein